MAGILQVLILLFSCFMGLFAVLALALFNFSNLMLRIVPPILALFAIRKIRNKENSTSWYSEFSRTQLMLGFTLFSLVFYVSMALIVVTSFGMGYYYEGYLVSDKLFSSLNRNMNSTSFLDILSGIDKTMNYTQMEVEVNKSAVGKQMDPKVFEPIGIGFEKILKELARGLSDTGTDIQPYLDRFHLKLSVIVIICILVSAAKVALIWTFGRRIRKHWKRERPFAVEDVFAAFLLPLAGLQIVNAFFWAAKDKLLAPVGSVWNWVCFYVYTSSDIAGALLIAMAVFERCLTPSARHVELGIIFVTLVSSISRYAEIMWRTYNSLRFSVLFVCSAAMILVCRKAHLKVQEFRYYRLRSSSFNGD